MRTMDIEHLEARLVRPPRGLPPALDHLGNLRPRERPWRRIGRGCADPACRDELPCFPIVDLGRRLERRPAFPRAKAPRLAARMAELDAGHRLVQLDEIDAAL